MSLASSEEARACGRRAAFSGSGVGNNMPMLNRLSVVVIAEMSSSNRETSLKPNLRYNGSPAGEAIRKTGRFI